MKGLDPRGTGLKVARSQFGSKRKGLKGLDVKQITKKIAYLCNIGLEGSRRSIAAALVTGLDAASPIRRDISRECVHPRLSSRASLIRP